MIQEKVVLPERGHISHWFSGSLKTQLKNVNGKKIQEMFMLENYF